jgi:hypothetical protein
MDKKPKNCNTLKQDSTPSDIPTPKIKLNGYAKLFEENTGDVKIINIKKTNAKQKQ